MSVKGKSPPHWGLKLWNIYCGRIFKSLLLKLTADAQMLKYRIYICIRHYVHFPLLLPPQLMRKTFSPPLPSPPTSPFQRCLEYDVFISITYSSSSSSSHNIILSIQFQVWLLYHGIRLSKIYYLSRIRVSWITHTDFYFFQIIKYLNYSAKFLLP